MKQTVLDILIYLFEHYIDDEMELDADRDQLNRELRDAGFDSTQVTKAFDWLQELAETREQSGDLSSAARDVDADYSIEEERKLDSECRGFLYFLEQVSVLDSVSRELVIGRVLALEDR